MRVPSDADASIVRYEPTMMVPALPVMSDAPPMATPTALARERDSAEDDTTTIEPFPIILKGKSDIARQPMLMPNVYQKPPPDGLGGQYILQLQAALFKDAVRRYAKFLANTNNPFSETRLRLFFCYV